MVAPPLPTPSGINSPPMRPSRHFCLTGSLEDGERYHPDIHNMGSTPRERCARFYQEFRGGKSKKRRTCRNKKSRKSRRKYRRNR